ncbi:MAG: hypothetical protein WA960_08885 [Tunicatimonas sp.]
MKNMIRSIGVTLVLAILAVSQGIAQCAMCRTTIENNVSAGDTSLASGLNIGIMYLFFAPYVVVGVIAFFWYRNSRKEHGKKIRLVRHPQS